MIQYRILQFLRQQRACLDTAVSFRPPIQIDLFLPLQNGEKAIFTVETVAEQNGPIFAKQAPSVFHPINTGTTRGSEFEGNAIQPPGEKNRKKGIGFLGL